MNETERETIPLRLKWRKTWPDLDDDFCVDAPVGGATIGRVMMTVGGPKNGQWQWTYQAAIKGLPWQGLEHSGFRPNPREAARGSKKCGSLLLQGVNGIRLSAGMLKTRASS